MASPEGPQNVINETSTNECAARTPKDGNEESIDYMLANVDQFIDSVYRDLSMSPPPRHSTGNALQTRRSVDAESSSSSSPTAAAGTLLSGSILGESSTNADSPITRRNMDAEIERINQICSNVDQNLRSIGVFMNNSSPDSVAEDTSKHPNLENSPSSSTSIIISTPVPTTLNSNNETERRGKHRRVSLAAQLIDLSNSQTETTPVELWETDHISNRNDNDDDDDDVILVSANIPPVVNLCTPNGHQEMPRPRYIVQEQFNRRRLLTNDSVDEIDICSIGTSSRRRRRTEPSFIASPPKVNKPSDTDKTSPAKGGSGTPFMCPVCMDSCLQHQPTSTLCGHVFCKQCIDRAIALTHKCPMCNKRLAKKQTFRIYL